ncbi:sulfite exporter TauE/SafE family protein [Chelativorans salis]|uniref:Probable membrane transporter protein n=1 Tax=Chelativorans salis TaxID=2978478 RepID=A0ABT2LV70_9HYPH|nr:sulfite exporter TauE/SafE family protein [Chelativorans sp. EGI FJ00035]MCT7378430.1 sulfite exporter TauE/SafE family protein [Chelativorans sp. EGI FJ00035]
MAFEPVQLAIIFACLAGGGILKGATGAGAPVLAVPALAMMFDVKFAVVVMLVPNLLTNIWQGWLFRRHRLPASFIWGFAAAGAAGVVAGTLMLAFFSQQLLSLMVAAAVFGYVFLRLARPDWKIAYPLASRLRLPAGLTAGVLQGASGISAPVSITFLNAMRLERPVFISTVSVFFAVMSALQIPALGYFGILSEHGALISLAALFPILAFMPVGSALARRLSKENFDRAILILLSLLALKLVYDALIS